MKEDPKQACEWEKRNWEHQISLRYTKSQEKACNWVSLCHVPQTVRGGQEDLGYSVGPLQNAY